MPPLMRMHAETSPIPTMIAAATTSLVSAGATYLPQINEYLRAGASIVAIIAGLITIALGVRKWKNGKD